jgi:hypothetical protein
MKRTWAWIGAAVLVLAFLYLPSLGIGIGQLLAFLLLLLCPLMHFLGGHRGSHHGSGEVGGNGTSAQRDPGVGAGDRER